LTLYIFKPMHNEGKHAIEVNKGIIKEKNLKLKDITKYCIT